MNSDPSNSLALRPRQAAQALAVSERTLWQLAKDGKIPFVKLGRAKLFPVDDLRRWLSEQSMAQGGDA